MRNSQDTCFKGAMKRSDFRRSSFASKDRSFSARHQKMSSFNLESAKWLGFDLDHTLVEYKSQAYEEMIFGAAYSWVI